MVSTASASASAAGERGRTGEEKEKTLRLLLVPARDCEEKSGVNLQKRGAYQGERGYIRRGKILQGTLI